MLPGELIDGRYLLERAAASGGMGTVYRAHDNVTGEAVAIKVLHDETALDEGRFAREAAALAELDHPSIVRYIHAEAGGVVCTERMGPAPDGIDFGLCIPRPLQDICLVEAARDQGADIREHSTFDSLHWRAGRVSGVAGRCPVGPGHVYGERFLVYSRRKYIGQHGFATVVAGSRNGRFLRQWKR